MVKLNRGLLLESLNDVEERGIEPIRVLLIDEFKDAAPHQLLRFIAEQALHGAALKADHATAVEDHDDVSGAVDDRLEMRFFSPQTFLSGSQEICLAIGIDDRIDLTRGERLDRAFGLDEAQGERDAFFGTVLERCFQRVVCGLMTGPGNAGPPVQSPGTWASFGPICHPGQYLAGESAIGGSYARTRDGPRSLGENPFFREG